MYKPLMYMRGKNLAGSVFAKYSGLNALVHAGNKFRGLIAMLFKTGQVTSYFPGDDGDLQKGIAQSFTSLNTGQYSGTTNIVVNGKTDIQSNNCVQDNNSKYMYPTTESRTVGPLNDGSLLWTDVTNGETIFNYVAAANAANYAGWNDWRVPNIRESGIIANAEAFNGAPDPTYWPTLEIVNYWTSTTAPNATDRALVMNYFTLDVSRGLKAVNGYPLLMVRG